MPPKKTIIVSLDALLTAIGHTIVDTKAGLTDDLADADARYKAAESRDRFGLWNYRCSIARDLAAADWCQCNLEHFAGRSLTASERIRHQQAVRQLEADGLVERNGRRITLTAAGWERYTALVTEG